MSKRNRYPSALVLLLSLLVAGSFGTTRASAQSYVFDANVFGTGNSPEALVIADFNADGQPDVATVNQGANTVSILLGNANATFKPHVDYAVGANPIAIVSADFNNDGKPDLAVVNSSNNSVSVLLGNGDGTFQAQAVNLVGVNPESIAAGDVNGDGKIDLVVANFNDNTVSVLLGNGDGTFTAATGSPVATGTGPKSVALADFTGDNNLDIVTADESINSVSVLLGNGDGTFGAHTEYATGRNPVQVAVADFNNDGRPDLATANGGEGNVTVLINSGGTKLFPSQGTENTYTVCTSLVVGDFNGDHNQDIAVSSAKSNTVLLLLGLGTGEFQPEVSYATGGISGGSPDPVAAADINGDGHLDLVVVNPADSTISVLLNNGFGVFSSASSSSAVALKPISLAVADFNGDGNLDVATVAYSATSTSLVSVLLGKGDGTFAAHVDYPTGTNPEFVAAGDFNGDGMPDLAVANFGDNTVTVLINNGDGIFAAGAPYPVGIGPTSIAVGDFNGDSKLDLAVGNATAGTVSILLGNGDGTFGAYTAYSAGAGANPSWVVAADLNGDGILDLAVADSLTPLAAGGKNTGADAVSVMLGKGDGTFPTAVQYTTGTNTAPSSVVAGDFNGDGEIDLATANTGTGTVSVLLNIGNGVYGSPVAYPAGVVSAAITAGDLTGSGTIDLISGSTSTFTNSIATLLGNGDGTFLGDVQHGTGFSSAPNRRQPVGVGDFNNDGNLDVVVTDENTNVVEVFLNEPAIAFSPGTLAFGGFPVGATSGVGTVTVSNTGSTPITLTSIVASGDFKETNTCPSPTTVFAVGATCAVSVTFTPAASGARVGSLTITDSLADSPQALSLTGTGVAPAASFSPASLNFSAGTVGVTSAPQIVTLTNTGSGDLTITSIASSVPFAETNTCGSTVAGGASCSISVTFTPSTGGAATGTITVTDNAPNSPQTVPLTGTGAGPAANLAPATATFASQPVGSTSTPQVITITNSGNATLSITKISAGAPFAETNNCAATLAASSSCTVSVTFTPTASGAATGSLTITDNAVGSPQSAALSGTGGTGPFVALSPGTLSFNTTSVGVSSSAQNVTLKNSGNAVLSITSIDISGSNSGDFIETNNCGTSLASGASCTIPVTFKPTAGGNRSASLTITDNASGSPQSVPLTGTASAMPVAAVSPSSLSFGTVTIGSPASKTVTLTNSGNVALSITSISATGSGYTATNTCGASVSAAASCTISVTFNPLAGGALNGTLAIADNALGSPQTVPLSGTGSGPAVDLAPTSLVFSGQLVNSKGTPQTVTLSNGGTTPLAISGITVTGAAASEYTEMNGCGNTLAPSASCTITVTFAPTSPGSQPATLSIADNVPGSPQNVPLTGAGADFSLSANTTSATVMPGQAAIYPIMLSPNGGFSQAVSLACTSTVPASSCTISPSSISLSAPNTATANVTITTTAAATAPPAPAPPAGPRSWLWVALVATLGLGLLLSARRRQVSGQVGRQVGRIDRMGWVLAVSLALVLIWAGCGGGSSSSSSAPTSTAAGTYSVTVTATASGISNKTTLTLVVQ